MANVLLSVAEWERETIGQRTREGMAAARAKGGAVSGPSVADRPELVVERIRAMRASGMTAALTLAGPSHREEGVVRARAIRRANGDSEAAVRTEEWSGATGCPSIAGRRPPPEA